MDGVEFLEAVRATSADVPFILFTGKGSEEVAAEALDAGATGYLQTERVETIRLLGNRIRRAVSEYRIATSHDEYETIVESLADPVYVLDERGRFTSVNDAFVELTGSPREEILGQDTSIIRDERMVDRAEHHLGRVLSAEGLEHTVFEAEIRTADGETLVCEDHIGVLPFEGERFEGSVGILRNVSERRPVERKASFLEEVVETAGVGIAVYTADGRFEYVNEAYADLLGTTPGALLEVAVPDVAVELDADRFDDYWRSYDPGETREHATVHRRADGTTVPVRTVTTSREIAGTRYHFGTVYPRDGD
jgi:PAS domain S-box-containing protein